MKELAKQYDPKLVENRIYAKWQDGGYFHAEVDRSKKPFSMVIPPPNITGQLHMGHALNNMLQDAIIRFKRMQGYCTLWLPGTDHASIATEARIVDAMRKEGITKDDIGRPAFLERAWEWKKTYGGRIVEQLKKLGSSCDWQRERFTLDDGCSRAVNEVFYNLYNKGLIYRGERIINWCPQCLTSLSDIEVDFKETPGSFWHIRYPLSDGSGYIEVATTRPETMLGDTAVAVNPDDPRYQTLVGKTVTLPLCNREIPIIADNYVDVAFGTGAVKITPAHDPNDFEVGQRHNLPSINILDESAIVNENGGIYQGLERYEARKRIVEDLDKEGYLCKVEDHVHNVGRCYRCSTTVEPHLSMQWFVKMQPLAQPAIEAVRLGKTAFVPERFDKMYYNWLENVRDWCISRQIWWGHRIPVWYCDDCGEVTVSKVPLQTCSCGSHNLRQDPDTLDTWFSSGLWPFSTLGWPEQTEELDYFYPTNTLVTGYDIIFFWVARMMFLGIEHMGEIPFNTVFINGLVRDAQGRKMSKSLGNGIDPLDIIDQYGADALRFTLAVGISPGNDMRFSEEKITAFRNFANKIWNASRFVLMQDVDNVSADTLPAILALEDKWIISRLNDLIKGVTENLERYEIGVAAAKIYDFAWDVFCDWYIEIVKSRLNNGSDEQKNDCKTILVYVLTGILKLLHPFMPFITEEIYQSLPHRDESIMISAWPEYQDDLSFTAEERDFTRIMDAVRAIRILRGEKNVPPSKKTHIFIESEYDALFRTGAGYFQRLAYADEIVVGNVPETPDAIRLVTDSARIFIPLTELIDKVEEQSRLSRELQGVEKELSLISQRLDNHNFVNRAPEAVVSQEKEKFARALERKKNIEQSLTDLNNI